MLGKEISSSLLFFKKENSYVFGSLQYQSIGISLTRNSTNTQVWRQLHVQILRKLRGGKFQTFEIDLLRNIPHSYYQKYYYFGLSSDCKGTADRYPSDSGCQTCESSRCQTTAVFSSSSEQCLCLYPVSSTIIKLWFEEQNFIQKSKPESS